MIDRQIQGMILQGQIDFAKDLLSRIKRGQDPMDALAAVLDELNAKLVKEYS
jgi:hypothetical protein